MIKDRQATSLERLTFFSDAVFAIAITLLVIEIKVPHLTEPTNSALLQALAGLVPDYIAFLVSFIVIARFWRGHHRIAGMLVAVPPRFVGANLALLLTIVFMPFPTAVLSDYTQLSTAGIFYALWLVVTGLANMVLVHIALHRPAFLQPDVTPAEIRLARRNCWIPVVIGLLAAGAALAAPAYGILVLMVVTPVLGSVIGWWTKRPAVAAAKHAALPH